MKKFIVEFSYKDFEKIKNFTIKSCGELRGLEDSEYFESFLQSSFEDSEYFESFLQSSFEECALQVLFTVKSCS